MGKIKKPNGLHPKKRRLDCYAYACNLNKPQDYVGQIAGYEDKDVFSKEEVIERLIADMLEEDVYVREASYEETPSDWEWKICIFQLIQLTRTNMITISCEKTNRGDGHINLEGKSLRLQISKA